MNHSNTAFYVSHDKYAQFIEGGFVVVADLYGSDELRDAVYWLDGSDSEAIEAGHKVKSFLNAKDFETYIGTGKTPVEAMQNVCDAVEEDLRLDWHYR